MSNNNPILILQMQRMGDLVLSYPLAGWLASVMPNNPVWVVGEQTFFDGLINISPSITYFNYSDAKILKNQKYHVVINLSHRPEAAELASNLKSDWHIGPYRTPEGTLYINGPWQLYRTSIAHNNRHNLFHWADLNAMEIISTSVMQRTEWPPIKPFSENKGKRIGLFVGASEAAKRPEPTFWANLAESLLQLGMRPVFLGGEADRALGSEAAAILKSPALNLCGKFSITELCIFMRELELLIVPDTGPMHIATWLGVPIINLSLGPVNPWETGPFAPGHYIIRSTLSCSGCWTCAQPSIMCKKGLRSESVAIISQMLLENKLERLSTLNFEGSQLFITQRDKLGLFDMEPVTGTLPMRFTRSIFWKYFFGMALNKFPQTTENMDLLKFKSQSLKIPGIQNIMLKGAQSLLYNLSKGIKISSADNFETNDFWLQYPPILRPLSSYLQLMLQNENFSRKSLLSALNLTELLIQHVQH